MNLITSLRAAVLVIVLSLPGASLLLKAAAVPVFGSGTNANNAALGVGGAIDPHYTVSYGTFSGPAIVDTDFYDGSNPTALGAWVPNQPDACWISTSNSYVGFPVNVPVYFSTTFDLTGLDPSTVSITIRWAADYAGSAGIYLNGVSIPGSAAPRNSSSATSEPWAHFTVVTVDAQHGSFFGPNVNTLTFVEDASSDGDTNGIIAEISGTGTPIAVSTTTSIRQGGVVPVYSSATTVQPGSWISIFGANLATGTSVWDGTFPTSLGGTSVTIDNKPAYLWYASPGQLNVQAPDDTATGSVSVVVTAKAGTATSTVTLGAFAPSFSLLDGKHVAGIIIRLDGSGAYGGGTYDILAPVGELLQTTTKPAKAGDLVALFGVGFGPTNPAVPAGHAFSGRAPTTNPVNVIINGVSLTPSFAGVSQTGLYQLNITIPTGMPSGDQSIVATVGGVQTQAKVVIPLQ